MIKLREDIKKIQLFTEGVEDEAHYIERVGSQFVYSYLRSNGNGVVHQIKDANELESFLTELYKGYEEYWSSQGTSIKLNLEEDLAKIKDILNV